MLDLFCMTDLSSGVTALRSQLVDLRLCYVGPLPCFLQLVLQLAQLAKVCIGLLLLKMKTGVCNSSGGSSMNIP